MSWETVDDWKHNVKQHVLDWVVHRDRKTCSHSFGHDTAGYRTGGFPMYLPFKWVIRKVRQGGYRVYAAELYPSAERHYDYNNDSGIHIPACNFWVVTLNGRRVNSFLTLDRAKKWVRVNNAKYIQQVIDLHANQPG